MNSYLSIVGNFLRNADIYGPLVSFIVAVLFFFYKKIKPCFADKIMLCFLLIQIVLNTLALYFAYNLISNHWVYYLNSLVTQIIFAGYFYRILHFPYQKKLVVIGSLVFLFFQGIEIFFLYTPPVFSGYSSALNALLIVGYAIMSLQMVMHEMPVKNILQLKLFWLVAALLLYFGSSFFMLISYQYLYKISSDEGVGFLWRIHNFFLAISSVIFVKALISERVIPEGR
ncbi:MAG TPA: hypothetical protein VFN30_01450 [Chitinophagaceae bacterium]|nr:hypothetical protein [Chitinophagaceae bacterium]